MFTIGCQDDIGREEAQEVLEVRQAHTVVDPRTVVVTPRDAPGRGAGVQTCMLQPCTLTML